MTLATLFENAPNAILVVDRDGVIVESNLAAKRVFGRKQLASGDELRGLLDAEESFDASRVIGEGAKTATRTIRFVDEAARAFEARVTIIPSGSAVALYLHDILVGQAFEDALFVLKEDLMSVNEALVERNTDLERFAAVAAHDLQEPLRKIALYSDLVRSTQAERLDEAGRQRLDVINKSARQMRELVSGLLLYSHSSGSRLQVEDVCLEELLNEACEAVRELILESDATIVNDPLPMARVDRSLMVHVLQNLLTNAMKYRRAEPPRVEVAAEILDGAVILRMTDNGQGFDMTHHDRIFQSFTRLHRKEEIAGTGIGLALCKRIVERHGGRIWAESVVGRGSSFFVRVARGREQPRAAGTAVTSYGSAAP